MTGTATHVLILSASRFECGLMAFGYSVRGLTPVFEPVVGFAVLPPLERGQPGEEYAARRGPGQGDLALHRRLAGRSGRRRS